jgi:prepilin-type N-terminal cleavage/methylation domain-containing protein
LNWKETWKDERGFTLVELLLIITLVGVLMAIASSSWFGAVESRRVDAATSQLAADLRQAHSKAINRLQPQTVMLATGSSQYTMTGLTNPVDLDEESGSNVVAVATGVTVAFCPNGSAEIPPATPACSAAPSGSAATITIGLPPDPTQEPNHTIQINPVTSRVRVVP